jgi:hypothetical protein
MTFLQFKERVNRGVLRSDLEGSVGDFINQALKEIQDRRSFTCMKRKIDLTVPAGSGNETVALPEGFKELQKRPAVHYVADDGSLIPAEVVSEEEQVRRIWAFGGTPISTRPPRVYFERNEVGAVLGLVEPMIQAMNFRVKYYAYLPDLVLDSDTSPLIDSYLAMVLAKAKSIAFSDINDEASRLFDGEFEIKLAEAIRQDAYSEVAGRELRM